jgi:hypothetical protein
VRGLPDLASDALRLHVERRLAGEALLHPGFGPVDPGADLPRHDGQVVHGIEVGEAGVLRAEPEDEVERTPGLGGVEVDRARGGDRERPACWSAG